MKTRFITRSALIAAIYAVLTVLIQSISYGPIQFRISEMLTILPVFMTEAIPGLAIGCLIANILSAYGVYDMIFGTFATLIAAVMTYKLRNRILFAGFPPVIINALIVPMIFILSGSEASFAAYIFNFATIFISEAIIVYIFAIPLAYGIRKQFPNLLK